MRKLLLVLNLLPTLALANPPMPGDHPPHGGFGKPLMRNHMHDGEHLPPFLQDIDLSDQQEGSIKSLLKSQTANIDETLIKEHNIKKQLHQLSFSNDYNTEKAQALIEQSLATHKTIALQKSQLDNAIFKLLTAEQQSQVFSKMAKFEQERFTPQ
jgi:periplasmic protein CpxP/Spy